jgi:MscS family membrane protein
MPCKFSRWFRICIVQLMLLPCMAMAAAGHPLEPLDLSSPRATLNSFLKTGDAFLLVLRDEYWDNPSPAVEARLKGLGVSMERMLDLSRLPPAVRFEMGRERAIYLYEVLSRIELPPASAIPGAAAYADNGADKPTDGKPASWTIPHTEITLERVADGPRAGQFLFSAGTVERAGEFYEKTRALPYSRDVPLQHYVEMRDYLSLSGWMLSPGTTAGFPDWLKYSVYRQAVWKWLGLIALAAITILIVVSIHRLARRRISGQSAKAYLHRLATPVTLLLLTPLVLDMANRELTLTGRVAEILTLLADAIGYFSLAWIAWTGSILVAELVIALPRIPAQSLNAHLLRLTARIAGTIAVIVIIFYVSNQLGAPLYSLVAGLGVGGIAIALATQNTLEHFIGSLALFADKPVRVGDLCRYGEDSNLEWQRIGTIESIGLRSTRIRGIDNSLTTIPNGDFSKMHLVNYNMRSRMLLLTILGLRYETTDDQLRYVIASLRDMLLAHPRVVDDEPRVRFAGFGDYALKVEIRVDINTSSRDEFRAIREDIFLRVMKIVKDAGTGFAFPSRTVYHTRDTEPDIKRRQAAEAQVRAWCSAQELPFPSFTADYRKRVQNTLDYPPEGSPGAS